MGYGFQEVMAAVDVMGNAFALNTGTDSKKKKNEGFSTLQLSCLSATRLLSSKAFFFQDIPQSQLLA